METKISKDFNSENGFLGGIRVYRPKPGNTKNQMNHLPKVNDNFITVPYRCKLGEYNFGEYSWYVTGCLSVNGGYEDNYFLSVKKNGKELTFKSITVKRGCSPTFFYDVDDNIIYRKKDLNKNKYLREDCGPIPPHMAPITDSIIYIPSPFTRNDENIEEEKEEEPKSTKDLLGKDWSPSNLEMPNFCVGERVLIEKWFKLPEEPTEEQIKDYKDFYNFMAGYSKPSSPSSIPIPGLDALKSYNEARKALLESKGKINEKHSR